MAIGDTFTAYIDSAALGGKGVLRLDGRAVFMAMTAPGDRVHGRINAEHKNWAEAELLEVEEASPLRVRPLCPGYGLCGGCSYQHIGYEAQLDIKKAVFAETLVRIGGIAPERFRAGMNGHGGDFLTIEASPPFEYRNRVSFHAAGAGRCGFKARKSAEVIPLDDCPAAVPPIRRALKEGTIVIPNGKERWTVFAKDEVFLSEAAERRRGTISLAGKSITVDAGIFFQSNLIMLEKLIAALRNVLDRVNEADGTGPVNGKLPMADLYAGCGTFSRYLADKFSGAVLFEQNREALELAKINLEGRTGNSSEKKLSHYYAERDDAWVKTLTTEKGPAAAKPLTGVRGRREKGGRFGFVIADPPRQGLSRSVLSWLAEQGPPVLAYVSCEPSSLARDCRLLAPAYEPEYFKIFDFYPQTSHIESLAVFYQK